MGQLYRDYGPHPSPSFRIGHWHRDIKLIVTSIRVAVQNIIVSIKGFNLLKGQADKLENFQKFYF